MHSGVRAVDERTGCAHDGGTVPRGQHIQRPSTVQLAVSGTKPLTGASGCQRVVELVDELSQVIEQLQLRRQQC